MSNTEIFGYLGAVCLTLLTYPQVYESYKHKSTNGLNNKLFLLQFLTSAFFLVYGILLPAIPVMVANGSALFGSILLIIAKLKFRKSTTQTEVVVEL